MIMFLVGFLAGAVAAFLFVALCAAGGDDDDN